MKEIRSRGAYDERRIYRNTKAKAFKRQVGPNRSRCKWILIKTFHKEAKILLITKKALFR